MSWLPQRWRTQRNAIRHANCRIQWVIKILNATCTSPWGVCLLECLFQPTTQLSLGRSRSRVSLEWRHVNLRRNNLSGLLGVKSQELLEVNRPSVDTCLLLTNKTGTKGATSNTIETRLLRWKGRFSSISIGPPISQDYPLNLSI